MKEGGKRIKLGLGPAGSRHPRRTARAADAQASAANRDTDGRDRTAGARTAPRHSAGG
jgi:hypothetical protein